MPIIENLKPYFEKFELLPPFNKKLVDIPNEDYELDVVDVGETVNLGETPVKFSGSLKMGPKLFVFNDPIDNNRDVDQECDDIISGDSVDDEVLIIPDYSKHAYIQYGLDAFLKAGVDSNSLGFSFSGNAKLRVNSYKIHENDKNLLDAVIQDFSDFQWIFSFEDLRKIKENEACSLEFSGMLSSSLEVSWSDLYSGSLMNVSKLVKLGAPLAINIDAGLTIGFDFSIKDDFLLVIKKIPGSKFEVGFKKNKIQSTGAGAQIGISASLSEIDLDKLVDNLLQQLYKLDKDKIDELLNKSDINQLSEGESETVNRIIETLGISSTGIKLDELKEKWNKLIDQIKESVRVYIESKIEVGVQFEYSQIKTNNCFLIAEFSETALKKYHPQLIKFKVNKIVEDKFEGLSVKKFLLEKGYKRTRGFGLGLKIAEHKLSIDHEASIELIERLNEKGSLHIVSKSERSYEGNWFSDSFSWTAGLLAETEGFVQKPRMDDLNFSLNLGFEWNENKKLEKNQIKKIADVAGLWGIIPEYKLYKVKGMLESDLKTKVAEDIKVSISLNIPHNILKDILYAIDKVKNQNSHYSLFAQAMAACMVPSDNSIAERIQEHGNYFLLYLKGDHIDHPTVQKYSGYISERHFDSLDKSIDIILNRSNERYSEAIIKEVIKGFNKFHNNIYRVKVLGYIMQYYARIINRLDDIEPTFQISYKKGSQESVMNFLKQ